MDEEIEIRSVVFSKKRDEEELEEEEIRLEREEMKPSTSNFSVFQDDDTSSTSSDISCDNTSEQMVEKDDRGLFQKSVGALSCHSGKERVSAKSDSKSILTFKSVTSGMREGFSTVKNKSMFSIFSMPEASESGSEDTYLEQTWGKASEWIYGRYMREMAKAVHREHWQNAVDCMGGIPMGRQMKAPSAWVVDDSTTHISTPSIATSASSFKSHTTAKPASMADPCSTEAKKEVLTEIRDEINEEEYFFKQIHPRFSGNYSVLIWTPYDSISPRARLISPYEIVSLSFCPHDGNLLVGGTGCGLVVFWDLTGRLEVKKDTFHYLTDPSYLESQRVINSQLKWRRSKRSFKQIHPTAITLIRDSHNSKIVDIQWINSDKEIDVKLGKVVPPGKPSAGSKQSLQFITTSEDRVMKIWDMKSEPKPSLNLRYPDKGFSRTATAKRPANLQQSVSKYSELHRRWPSVYTAEPKHDDTSFFFSVCAFSKQIYTNVPNPDSKGEDDKALEGAFFGSLNGEVGHFTWEGVPLESVTGSLDSITTQVFKVYHDGPVNCVARHPLFEHVCITTGGHVFAIWNLNYPSEPIKWVRNRDVVLTYCGWSKMRGSIFRIARADGLIEFWDLLTYSHRPKVDPLSTGNAITMAVDLRIPPDKHFIAIADVNASLRLYCIVGHIKELTEEETECLRKMIDNEPERKRQLKEWSDKWISEHVGKKVVDNLKEKEEVYVQPMQARAKEVERPSCNPFMVQLYKWYLRRRGDKSVWLDEADKKWYTQEQAHMKAQILANKMWDQKKMDAVMKQLDVKEKREIVRKQRVQEILDQADEIFKAAVADIFLKKEIELKASKISVKIDEPKEFDIMSAIQETQLLFGENSSEFEEEKMSDVARFAVKERKMLDVLAKYRQVRMVFNDSRRNRDSKLKWLRSKLRREVEKYGCELIESQTKTNTLMKWEKYERRINDIMQLREMYGIRYNPLWDKDKRVSKFEKRMAIGNIPVMYSVTKKKKRRDGLDLESIIEGEEISVLTPMIQEDKRKIDLGFVQELPKDLVVEQETKTVLSIIRAQESATDKEPSDQSAPRLPEIKKSVSFSDKSKEETSSGGVLPLPDIVPRTESQPESESPVEPRITFDKDFRPYLETLLSQQVETSESSEGEDFEPDIAVMEQHRDVDEIVDKLSSVYAMLKADVNIKPELHRFKWETTEEYLVSDEEEEKRSDQDEENAEEEVEGAGEQTPWREGGPEELGSEEYRNTDSDELLD